MKFGYIKLFRKIKDNPIYSNSKALHCWVECLLRANHSAGEYYLGRKKLILQRGEFILGRDEFGKSVSMSGSTAWFWIERFSLDSMLDIKKTSKGCLCKIKNWEIYQPLDSNLDNKKTGNKQQINTDNNDKKKENDNIILHSEPSSQEIEYIPEVKEDKTLNKQIIGIMMIFKQTNPLLSIGHKTQRTAIAELIKELGYEKVKSISQYAVQIQGKPYAPTITTPYNLKNKLADLRAFFERNKNTSQSVNLDNI